MKRYIHLGLCCLLANALLHVSHVSCEKKAVAIENPQDLNKKEGMVSGVVETVSGFMGVIQGAKVDKKDPQKRPLILQSVGRILAGILNFTASAVQKGIDLSSEDVEQVRCMLDELTQEIDRCVRPTVMRNARSMNSYLKSVSIDELDALLNRNEDNETVELDLSEDDKELQAGILNSLNEMLHNLFEIIHNPENSKVIGQNIADILASIMNVASQALKYECLTSKNAEENVAQYLDSFSAELTKEIRHLMLQTALHLRNESTEVTRKSNCCKPNCCKPNCCKPKANCCKKECNTCCNRSVAIDDTEEVTRKSNCCKPNCCKPKANCCKKECNTCCNRSVAIDDTEEVTRKSGCCKPNCCKPNCCKPKNNCCKKECNTCCNRSVTTDDTEEVTRKSGCCKPNCCKPNCCKPKNNCCKKECNTCCNRSVATDEPKKACGCNKPKPKKDVPTEKDTRCACTENKLTTQPNAKRPIRKDNTKEVTRVAAMQHQHTSTK